MSKKKIVLGASAVVVLGVLYGVFHVPSVADARLATDAEAISRGAYIFNAGGCGACHQPEGTTAPIGGYEIKVEKPFPSTFHVPNITPDPETGIGGWTGKDFLLALKHGRKPGGGFYFPAFPYRSYKDMTDQDVLDVGAYLMSLPPVKNSVPPHELPAWQFRWMMAGWNLLANVLEGTEPSIPADDPQLKRGAYLARALGHCGECHTPRNALGMMQRNHEYAGIKDIAPDIDPAGIGHWTTDDFMGLLEFGITADFEYVGGEMADVVKHTSVLTEDDRRAYAAFFTRGNHGGSTE